jgi:hypothetical protein
VGDFLNLERKLDPPEESPESRGSINASSLLIPFVPLVVLLLLFSLVVRKGKVVGSILGEEREDDLPRPESKIDFDLGDFASVLAFNLGESIRIGFKVITSDGAGLSLEGGTAVIVGDVKAEAEEGERDNPSGDVVATATFVPEGEVEGATFVVPFKDAEDSIGAAVDTAVTAAPNIRGSVTAKFRSRTMRATESSSAASVRPLLTSAPVYGKSDRDEIEGKGKLAPLDWLVGEKVTGEMS